VSEEIIVRGKKKVDLLRLVWQMINILSVCCVPGYPVFL